MRVGTSYKQQGVRGDFDAVVIGSGMGGLASAMLLASEGARRVLVLERHYTAGGFTQAFYRPGFDWDVGVHYIGQTHPGSILRATFDRVSDGALEWEDMGDVYDRVVIGGDAYDFRRGRQAFRDRMVEYFPREADAIDGYLAKVREATRATQAYFAERVMPAPVAAVAGWWMRRPLLQSNRTTIDVLRSLTRDRRLIAVLTAQWGDYGLPPGESSFIMQALVASHYFAGASYPVGGATRIAQTIVRAIESRGGSVLTSAEVAQILVDGDRAVGVRMADGLQIHAPVVVSDAGVFNTFGPLLPEPVRTRLGVKPRAERLGHSASHACLYVGLSKTARELALPKSNLWIYPSDDHDLNVAQYFDDPSAPLPVAFISFPSAKDPDFERRYPGHATIEVVTLAPYEWFEPWEAERWHQRGLEYEALKSSLQERLLDALYTHVPQVQGHVAHAELSTPVSTRHFAGHPRGEIYGLAHTPERFAQRWLRPRTPIRGLYLTGADICTAGVGGALLGGVMTSSAILGRNLLAGIAKERAARRPAARATSPAEAT